MKDKTKYAFWGIVFSLLNAGTIYATPTAAKGVFTVNEDGKTIQFANAIEPDLVQWSTAETWSEANKNAEGHNGWYVLDYEEWTHLLITRGIYLNNLGTVNGDSGLIILPDGWVQPVGIPRFKPVNEGILYANNIYTSEQWEVMAETGAVFLPCHGYGYNDPEDDDKYKEEQTKIHGTYWSSSPNGGSRAYCTRFYNYTIHDQNNDASKSTYRNVILVKEVTVTELDEEHEMDDFEDDLEAATGKDFAIMNRTMAKDGTLYTLCLPFDVPDVDASPLAGAEIFTFDGGRVSGASGSEVLYLYMSPLEGKRLTQGVPYLLQWENTGESITRLCFYHVENWDDNTATTTDPGNTSVKFHGVYPRAQIPGYDTGAEPHYNFFLGANNTLYWPDQTTYPTAKMKGFRAYFYITPGGGPDPAPVRRGMQAVWKISGESDTTTGILQCTMYNEQCTKVVRNGQIYLMYKGTMYDVQGNLIDN